MKTIKSRYIMFVDSDDFLPENAVTSLMDAAYSLDADIVQGGYFDINGDTEEYLGCTKYSDCTHVPPNGVVTGMAWGKVYKSTLFEKVCFPENYWYEDTIITGIITHLARSIATISDMVYYYRKNNTGITRTSVGKPKCIDTLWVQNCVLSARKELGIKTDLAFYEHLIRMGILCYQRTKNEPDDIKLAAFSFAKAILEEEREEDFVVRKQYRFLEKAILEGDYRKYSLICKTSL